MSVFSRLIYSVVLACVALGIPLPSWASGPQALPGYKFTTPPTIDGVIQDSEWAGASTGKGSFDSNNGDRAPEPMQFWLGYDDRYVYFAARLGDSQPRTIKALQYDTNVTLTGDDNVQLNLDLGGSLANYNVFSINPRGATSVVLEGGRANKLEWTGELIAKARITPDGWEAETRIPWQMMHLPKAGVRDIRFNVNRIMPRTQRQYSWAYVDFAHPSDVPYWQSIPIPPQQHARTLKLLPFTYAGFDPRVGAVFNSGLDMKTELTDKATLVGTINPDFRNIENQVLSLDFSRFERLPGETRPFLLEGSQFMSSQLYSSQRIQNVDAGLNAYGRLSDKASFGIIETTRFGHENDFVGNVSYDPSPKDSYRITLSSLDQPGLRSGAYLARYSRQMGSINLFVRSMGSDDTETGAGQFETAALLYQKKEWFGFLEYDWASPKFNARLGLIPEIDFRGENYGANYDKVFPRGQVSEASASYSGTEYTHIDGSQYRRHNEVDTTLSLRLRAQFTLNYYTERFNGEDDHLMQMALLFPRDDAAHNFSLEYDHGELALIPYNSVSATSTYRFGKRLQASLRYQRVTHPDVQDQLILTGSYDLRKKRSLSGRIIKSNSDINGYVSLQQSGNRGIEYFLILGDPNASRFSASIILKIAVPIDVVLGGRRSAS